MNRAARISLLLCASLCFSPVLLAATLTVPGDFPDIQSAVDAAANGDVIVISPGRYSLTSPVDVRGKALTLRGAGPNATILDGQGTGTILTIRNNDTSLLVVVEEIGFENGRSTEVFHGGCLVVRQSRANIENNRFEGCTNMTVRPGECDDEDDPNRPPQCGNSGGAIKVSVGSEVILENNLFRNNRSFVQGGAVHVLNSNAVARNNRFIANRSEGSKNSGGGGFKVTGFGGRIVEVLDNHFEDNQSSFTGGAISVFDGSAIIRGNTIINNGEPRFGGGIHFETGNLETRRLELLDNWIEGNVARNRDDQGLIDDFVQVSGGGMHLNFLGPDRNTFNDSVAVIRGNTFKSNSAHDEGCGSDERNPPCGVGGGFEFLRGRSQRQEVVGNVLEGNTADIYAAANFDKVNLFFAGNMVRSNKARFAHPGIGCVADRARTIAPCEIAGNWFQGNAYEDPGSKGTGRLNDSATINVRRNSVRIYNNLFLENVGNLASVFIRHEDIDDAFSEVVHNTFVGERTESVDFGVFYLRGEGLFQSNIIEGGKRGFRIDAVEQGYDLNARFNNITDAEIDLARIDRLYESPTVRLRIRDIGVLNSQPEASDNSISPPGFEGKSSADFSLAADSQLVNRAPCIDWVRVDYMGNPRPTGDGCDIGAFEFFVDGTIFMDRFEAN